MRHGILKSKWWGAGAVGILTATFAFSCANIGNPDGGPYDELPPKFVKSTPQPGSLNNKRTEISIEFDEFIQLENASEKIVVSPPQIQMPEIKVNGKRVEVNLEDTLQPDMTYTIDFADAIVDNNEGNPLNNYTFTFSTGNAIDTMEVSGTVLDASNLEPVKGILVGLHSNLADSAFVKKAFERVARTDSRGRFIIRGIAPGTYRVYALQDANQNFLFDQKSEMIAFTDSLVVPRFEQRMRQDTVWKDTVTVDTIVEHAYTHFLPDDILLRAFKEDATTLYMVKNERMVPQKFSFYFSAPVDSLPRIEGLNFDAADAFLLEHSLRYDTLTYWLKDTLLCKQDTLGMAVHYLYTDTLGQLSPITDTLNLASRQIVLPKKKRKKDDDEPAPTVFLKANVAAASSFDVYSNVEFEFEQPLAWFDSTAIHLQQKVDTLWTDVPFVFEKDSLRLRNYRLRAFWEPEGEFKLTVDSAAFHSIYGLFTDKIEKTMKVKALSDYATLYWNIIGIPDTASAIVELLDSQDKVVRRAEVGANGGADFYYLNPGTYYARLFIDSNKNGVWDTGLYAERRQGELVCYYPMPVELKAYFEVTQDWNLFQVPADRQKPDEIKKQKPEERKKKNYNRDTR